jgi:non-ribosomal peptide synthetase component F
MGTLTEAHKKEMNNLLIHQLFELQKNKTPDAVAVIFGNQSLTYSQLGQRADNLAAAILANSHV